MLLPIIQDIQDFQEPTWRQKIAEEAAKAISFNGGIAEIEFQLSCVFHQIGNGILYVNKKYGAVAEHFFISEERCPNPLGSSDDYVIQYIKELDGITVDYKYLGMMCLGLMKNYKYSIVPLEYWGTNCQIHTKDLLFAAGVEEAHHAYFIKSGKVKPGESYGKYRTIEEYKNDIVEKAAFPVIRQALRENNAQLYRLINGRCVPCAYPG